jgi:hypothetical protein
MASNDHPNAALVRKALEAFNAGDPEEYGAILADDIVWHQIGDRTLHGKEELAAGMPSPDSGESITTEVHDVIANDEHVIALVEAHATRADGRTLDYRTAEIAHVRDGKVTERWAFSDDTQRIKDFFA